MTQQQQPRIGIVIGSTREGRFGEKPAHWIHEIAKQRTDLAFELIDLRDHPLPFFNEPMQPRLGWRSRPTTPRTTLCAPPPPVGFRSAAMPARPGRQSRHRPPP